MPTASTPKIASIGWPSRRMYGDEIWSLYEGAKLQPDAVLTGRFAASTRPADVAAVMQEIACSELRPP